ncbi:hypothetical protein ACH5RR_025922 [Cinchona calisaya]|uniref:Uncharacterized protein n=1 Tax=Cinchona calisaya TaxID=153742 RepID=A0ABD2Z4E7_9GENT
MLGFTLNLWQIKEVLREWNSRVFSNVFENISKDEDEMKQSELEFENVQMVEAGIAYSQAQAKLLSCLRDDKEFWKQKARLKWIKDWDVNTKLFHASVQEKHVCSNNGGRLLNQVDADLDAEDKRAIHQQSLFLMSSPDVMTWRTTTNESSFPVVIELDTKVVVNIISDHVCTPWKLDIKCVVLGSWIPIAERSNVSYQAARLPFHTYFAKQMRW